jgi:hypothetical protein
MIHRVLCFLAGVAILCAASLGAAGQTDLEGIWTNGTVTPFERPAELAGKAFFTEQEASDFETQTASARNSDRRGASADQDLQSAYNNRWYDWGSRVVKTRRTSIIIDPPDGHVPALTPKGRAARREWDERQRKPPAGPEDIGLAERCIAFPTAGPPMLPYAYNNNYRILQAPGYVVISIEMVHDVRIIPIDESRPHLDPSIRLWLGDSRGHWEGNTLVVDTSNFNGRNRFGFFYSGLTDENYHLTERFTRTDPDTILYQFTVDDPTMYVRPFTGELTMSRTPGPTYEYACHEGNYAMEGMLAGARAEEKKK